MMIKIQEKTFKKLLGEFHSLMMDVENLGCTCVKSGDHGKNCSGVNYTKKARILLHQMKKKL